MSAKHPRHFDLIGVVAAAALALGLVAPASAQHSADREGVGEFGLQLMDFPGVFVTGNHGATLDVGGDLAWGFS
ncbi:MAG TPA: hypothetical protein VL131_10940, partial [Gammaproteobacteria bacterium]|nr:hypothetical protein [Gammaproteobacteria bacterium]